MPEVERKMKLRRDVLWGSGELKGNKGEKKSTTRKRGELFIRVKWLSVRAIYLLPRRWQEWAGVRYHSSAEVERQIYLSSVTAIRPPISPSVWLYTKREGPGSQRQSSDVRQSGNEGCKMWKKPRVMDGWIVAQTEGLRGGSQWEEIISGECLLISSPHLILIWSVSACNFVWVMAFALLSLPSGDHL